MKKLISIFLAFILMFTCVLPVFAENAAETPDTSVTDTTEDTETDNGINLNCLERIIELIKEFFARLKRIFSKEPEHNFVRGLNEEYHWQVCSSCGKIQFKDTHIFDGGVVKEEPTCLKEGKKCTTCVVCGYEIWENIDVIEHIEMILPAVEPSCNQTGLTEGRKCKLCGTVTVEQKEIASHGHEVIIIPAVEPTCTQDGLTEGKKCADCNEIIVEQQVILAAHTPNGEATCTTASVCKVCGTELAAATGHTPGAEATCTNAQTCTVCNAVINEKLPHTYDEPKTIQVTELTDGYTYKTCQVCSYVYKYSYVDRHSLIYIISSAEDLRELAQQVNEGRNLINFTTIRLINDIDLNNEEWTPIGTKANPAKFTEFDGQGHTISNLKIDRPYTSEGNNSGLFGYIGKATEIKNTTLNNVTINGSYRVGAFVGEGSVERYSSLKLTGDVKIRGWKSIGGIAGAGGNYYNNIVIDVNPGSFINTADINGKLMSMSFDYVGAVVGQQWTKEMIDVTSNIDVYGAGMAVGGIAGSGSGLYKNVHCSGNVYTVNAMAALESVYYTNTDPDGNAYGPVYYWMCNGKITGFGSYNPVTYENCTSTGTISLVRGNGEIVNSNGMYFYNTADERVEDSRFGGSRNTSKGDSIVTIID